jgi:hypothetical protein
VSNNHELSLFTFYELSHVVQSEFKHDGLGSLLGLSSGVSNLGFSFLLESNLLVLLGLWAVLG